MNSILISRAGRLMLAGGLSLVLPLIAPAQNLRLLVGTYTEGTPAEGVYLYEFNPEAADSRLLSMAPAGNPSFVITNPSGTRAYSVNEYNDGRQAVSAFALGGESLTFLGSVPIPKDKVDGEDPCNMLFDGETIISSNYTGGSVSAFPLDESGNVQEMSQCFWAKEEPYTRLLTSNLRDKPAHMHCAVHSPDGKYIFVTNLGHECIHRFDRVGGDHPLGRSEIAWQSDAPTRFGPRHMIFSRDGRFAYLLCELGDKLVAFSYKDGKLSPIQTLHAYEGDGHGSADIHLSPDGRFLYTSHRLKEDGIAIFSVNKRSGKVRKAGYQPTGKHPRNFAITPDGRYLLCACRDDNQIEIYSRNMKTGALSPTGKIIEVGAPVCVQFLP